MYLFVPYLQRFAADAVKYGQKSALKSVLEHSIRLINYTVSTPSNNSNSSYSNNHTHTLESHANYPRSDRVAKHPHSSPTRRRNTSSHGIERRLSL